MMRDTKHILSPAAAVLVLAVMAACSPAPIATGISDPHEAANRRVHRSNLAFDQAFFGPASRSFGEKAPDGVRNRISDFAHNIALPSLIVNNILQGNVEDAVHNSIRLVFNSTLGLGGLFDTATDIGLEERGTDFGETLHVWGVPEGDYVVMPFFGPSTQRDAVGTVVDLFTNPLSYTLPTPYNALPTVAPVVGKFGDRFTYGATFDDVFYSSADPYATARLFYLDNRRYTLGQGESTDDLYDIYEQAYE